MYPGTINGLLRQVPVYPFDRHEKQAEIDGLLFGVSVDVMTEPCWSVGYGVLER